jgi:integrase
MPQRLNFTDLSLRSLTPGEYWDTKLPAFGIRVGKTARTFILKKANRRITLGRFPSLTLQGARQKAHSLKGETSQGGPDVTLGDAVDTFLAIHCKSYRSASKFQAEYLLRKLEPVRHKKLGHVTTHDMTAILDLQKPSTANHFFAMSRTFFRFCVRRSLIEKSPLQHLSVPHKTSSRARVLTDAELRAVWHAADKIGKNFGTITKLLILTGQRRGEIGGLREENIDLKNHIICLKPEQVKNNHEHSFPISALAASLLSRVSMNTSKPLFPARGKATPYNNWQYSKLRIDKLSGVKDWTLHDLRRTFATRLSELGTSPHVVERLLNHVTGSLSPIALVYNRARYMDQMREAVGKWEAELSNIIGN